MKYYFITYQIKKGDWSASYNDVTDITPMEYINNVIKRNENSDHEPRCVILNTLEISKGDYLKYKNDF